MRLASSERGVPAAATSTDPHLSRELSSISTKMIGWNPRFRLTFDGSKSEVDPIGWTGIGVT
jgi:hypothetical protein